MATFLHEYLGFLESTILSVELLFIAGDFNIYVNDVTDVDAIRFLDLLESMNLKEHVHGPTHERGHTLVLIITMESDTLLVGSPTICRFLSDHAAVFCNVNSARPPFSVKSKTFRKLKAVDVDI